MVICLERGADLHMAQRIPLPVTVSCFSKIQIGFTFLVSAHPGSPGQRAVKRVCVCVYHIAWGTYVYLPKVADFTYLTCISHPHWGWPRSNFKMFFGVRELESEESLGYLMALFALSRIQPFWHNSSLWQTDGQTRSHRSELVQYKACLLNNCTLFLLHFVVMWGYFREWNCTWYSDICFDVYWNLCHVRCLSFCVDLGVFLKLH